MPRLGHRPSVCTSSRMFSVTGQYIGILAKLALCQARSCVNVLSVDTGTSYCRGGFASPGFTCVETYWKVFE